MSAVGQNGLEMHLNTGLSWAQEVQEPRGAEKLDIPEGSQPVHKLALLRMRGPQKGEQRHLVPLCGGCPQRRVTPVTYVTLNAGSAPGDDAAQLPGRQGVPFSLNPN